MAHVSILGAGSWGTALGVLLTNDENNHTATLWEFNADLAKQLQQDRENKKFLAGVPLPENLSVTNDLDEALEGSEAVLLVVPSQVTRAVLERIGPEHRDKVFIGASKGIENTTLMRMSQVVADVLGEEVMDRYVSLSGPSHAEEVGKGIPTSVVVASRDLKVAHEVQQWFSGPSFRAYRTEDVVGVELGASLKNVVAIATGILDGMGFGDNTRGAVITRGLHEITRLGVALGGQRETFAGLSGMGDLITTCTSKHSRNRHVGEELGRGKKLDQILAAMHMVAEGVATTRSAYDLAVREEIEMPITEQVYRILFEDENPKEAVIRLMTRKLKVEHSL